MVQQNTIDRTLSRIEYLESELLSWGIVDGFFSATEIEDLIYQVITDDHLNVSPSEVQDSLLEKKLLMKFPGDVYRSRMAETVRLLSTLRQWREFHPDWRVSPALVSDFRFITKPRRYPARDISLEDVIEDLENNKLLSKIMQVMARKTKKS